MLLGDVWSVYGLDWEVLRGASGPGFDVYSCGCMGMSMVVTGRC